MRVRFNPIRRPPRAGVFICEVNMARSKGVEAKVQTGKRTPDPLQPDDLGTLKASAPIAVPTRLEVVLGRAAKFLFAPRMAVWLWLSVVLLVGVWWFAAHMLKVVLYKVVLLTIAGFVGDKIARGSESSNKRPHEMLARAKEIAVEVEKMDPRDRTDAVADMHHLERRADAAYLRRAILIGAAMIAAALGT